jgi:hypothetical protein
MRFTFFCLIILSCFRIYSQDIHLILNHQIEAFNAHDIDGLTKNLSEDFTWYSVMKDSTIAETEGIESFKEAMRNYFSHFSGVRTKIISTVTSGKVISFKEEVSWDSESGRKSQSSIGVYLIEDSKISRAWYIYEQ